MAKSKAANLGSHREEIFASILRYTDIEPIMQISEALA